MERKKCKEEGKACWVKEQFLSLWPHPGKGEERRDSLKGKLGEIVKSLLNHARVFRLSYKGRRFQRSFKLGSDMISVVFLER